jgi:hypothetical protein
VGFCGRDDRSVLGNLYVIRRDAKFRRLAQARKIAFYVDIVDRNQDEIDPHDPSSGVWYDVTSQELE